jgi:hypothetical protein
VDTMPLWGTLTGILHDLGILAVGGVAVATQQGVTWGTIASYVAAHKAIVATGALVFAATTVGVAYVVHNGIVYSASAGQATFADLAKKGNASSAPTKWDEWPQDQLIKDIAANLGGENITEMDYESLSRMPFKHVVAVRKGIHAVSTKHV